MCNNGSTMHAWWRRRIWHFMTDNMGRNLWWQWVGVAEIRSMGRKVHLNANVGYLTGAVYCDVTKSRITGNMVTFRVIDEKLQQSWWMKNKPANSAPFLFVNSSKSDHWRPYTHILLHKLHKTMAIADILHPSKRFYNLPSMIFRSLDIFWIRGRNNQYQANDSKSRHNRAYVALQHFNKCGRCTKFAVSK